jgi:hypothetical protein
LRFLEYLAPANETNGNIGKTCSFILTIGSNDGDSYGEGPTVLSNMGLEHILYYYKNHGNDAAQADRLSVPDR